MPLVSLIMPVVNSRRLLEIFSPSLMLLDYSPLEILIVDNGSTDDTVEWLTHHRPKWRVLRLPSNLGTAGGWNHGARHARGEYLFFISNDLWFEPDAVSSLVRTFSENPTIGAAGCKTRRITEKLERLEVLDPMGNMVDLVGFPIPLGIGERDTGQYDQRRPVFFVQAGAMMIRAKLFEEVGRFDETMFAMSDDIDLCWRVRLRGFEVVIEPRAVVWHRGTASEGGATTVRRSRRSHVRYLSERNTLRMLLKNWSGPTLLLVLPVYCFQWLCEALLYSVLGQGSFVGSLFRAVAFNLWNLPETLRLRRAIQRERKVRDRGLLPYVSLWPEKFRWGWRLLRVPRDPLWKGYFHG